MVKVLYFVDRLLWGGIQSLLVDILKNIDKEKFIVDLLLLDDGKHYELEDKLRAQGVTIYKLENIWIRKPSDFFPYLKALSAFFSMHHDYDAIHMNSGSKNVFVLKYAKKYCIPVRIAHSHNTGFQSNSKIQQLIGNMLKPLIRKYATHYFACSASAGSWLFGKQALDNGKVTIVKNGIVAIDFMYNPTWRTQLRSELGINQEFVIGCVGRFTHQKNHKFLISIVYELKKIDMNTKLLLIGEGELETELQELVKSSGLSDDVIFLGFREDRNRWLSAMDAFVLTSTFEGLGIVLIEAQAAGLQTFASANVVPIEAQISHLLHFIPLSEQPAFWAKEIIKAKQAKRENQLMLIRNAGYDMKEVIKDIQKVYAGEK